MKRLLTILLLIAVTASAQMPIRINCAGASSQMIGAPGALGSNIIMVLSCGDLFSKTALNLGPQDPSLNPSSWYSPGWNLLTSSGDMTGTGWMVVNATVSASGGYWLIADDATNGFHGVQQAPILVTGNKYTITAKFAPGTFANALIYFRDSTSNYGYYDLSAGATDGVFGGSVTGSGIVASGDGYICVLNITVVGVSGPQIFVGMRSAAKSIIYVGSGDTVKATDVALIPGTHTAAEAAAIYEAIPVKHNWWDYASGGNDGCFGGNCTVATTNDPTPTPYDYNGWGPRSRTDLTHADWTATTATATATTFTPTAQNGGVTISYTGLSGASYLVSAELSSAGNLGLQWTTGATNPAVTVTVTPTRYSVAYTGTGAAENIGLRDGNAAGWGAITATDWQVEQVPSSTTTPSAYSAEAQTLTADLVTDDFIDATAALSGDWTIMLPIRADAVSKGLWRNGATTPNVSLDANGKVSYAGGGTVTATNAITVGLWHVIAITNSGGTITHCLDGVANGSGTSGSGNAFSALRFGYDGTAYFDGKMLPGKAWTRALSATELKTATCDLAGKAWNYDHAPFWSAKTACPLLDFSVDPTN